MSLSQRVTEILELLKSANTLEIAKGNIVKPLHAGVNKFGENHDVDTGTPEDLWSQGGTYVFSSTANIDTISSSDNGDTQDVIIEGLDVNFELVIQTITLTGQTKKVIDTDLIRVFRAFNASSTNFAGDIYIYINGATISAGVPTTVSDIRAKIDIGDNQTLMAVYTIPAGKTGYMMNWHINMSKLVPATALTCSVNIGEFGGVFRVQDRGAAGTEGATSYTRDFATPLILPEKTDIKITVDTVTANNTDVSGGFDIILVDN